MLSSRSRRVQGVLPMKQANLGEGISLRSVEVGGLRQEISDILREAIWQGTLKPGHRLNEQWLSGQLGVSRPPLREAIRVLEQEGLVVSSPRRGAFVQSLAGEDIFEIYAVRCALEGMAAELLMDRASPEMLQELEHMIDQVEASPDGDLRVTIDQDFQFHRRLVMLSGSARLAGMWEQLAGQLRLALTLVDPAFFRPDYVELTHRPLVSAIRRHDGAEVWRLTRTLLDVGRSLRTRWSEEFGEKSETEPASPSATRS
jgi:DNA-binding GntR family transcriptional regulator